ncbi:MAG: cupin domain-containing protein [Gammaproteobacteria bacterium]
MKLKLVSVVIVLALAPLAVAPGWADTHVMVLPNDLKWADVPSLPPGAKIALIEGKLTEAAPFTFRLKFPAGYQIPAHWHPATERVTVLAGTLNLGLGEKLDRAKTHGLTPGSVMIMQAKTPHYGWTTEETTVQIHGTGPWGVTYVNPADDPRKK